MSVKTKKIIKEKKASKAVKKRKPVFIWAVGRRRTATARVRLYSNKTGGIAVNDKPIEQYFPGAINEKLYLAPLRACNLVGKHTITIRVEGSGKVGQLGAVVHGMARALVKLDVKNFRPVLKKKGFLTRDPRTRERRKVGTGGKARRQKQSPRR